MLVIQIVDKATFFYLNSQNTLQGSSGIQPTLFKGCDYEAESWRPGINLSHRILYSI